MLSINITAANASIAGLGLNLKSGDSVLFSVISRQENNNYLIRLGGSVISVKSEIPLQIGQAVKGWIYLENRRIVIRLENPVFSRFNPSQGLFGETAGSESPLLRAFMLSGLSLDTGILKRFSLLLKDRQEEPHFLSRLVSLFLRKGIEPTSELLDSCFAAIFDQERQEEDDPEERPRQRKEPDAEPGEKPPAQTLTDQLHSQWESSRESNPLHLFNHITRDAEHWILLPFSTRKGTRQLKGYLSLKINRSTGKPDSAFLKCRGEQGDWNFFLDHLSRKQGKTVVFELPLQGTAKIKEDMKVDLIEKLHNLGFENDDNIDEGFVFDGFTAGASPSFKGIERFV